MPFPKSQQEWADLHAADLLNHGTHLWLPDQKHTQENYREASARAAAETVQPADWPLNP